MNVEGDFRYVDSGGFDECADFLEHLEICDHNWETAFVSWAGESKRWKEDSNSAKKSWGPWNLVKVIYESGAISLNSNSINLEMPKYRNLVDGLRGNDVRVNFL